VLKLSPPVTPAMRRGTSVHSLIKKHYSQPSLVPDEVDQDVREVFSRFLSSRFNVPPIGAEISFRFPVKGADVRGRIDTLLPSAGRLEVVDFKSGRAPDETEVRERLQLPVYASAVARRFEVAPSAVQYTYYFLRDGTEYSYPYTEEGERATIERVQHLINGIQKGQFDPSVGCDCYACRRRDRYSDR
jgi:DNA helicase-2/ATP-dependent DNA helicase PcrA